jgi:transcriptional regulator with XRE-family HTH domain
VSGDENAAGARIARARRRRGLSQSVLAGLVGRSESWLSQVERGKRGVDSYVVLTRMAEVLRVEVEELTGPGGGDGEEGQRVYEPAAEIERAMMGYEAVSASIGGRQPAAEATAAHLRARASAAYAGYQATRYDDTGRMLPALIRDTEAAGGDDREACSVRTLVYDTAAALLHRVGETSLAWTAADRALAAAEQSGRPELVALQVNVAMHAISASLQLGDAKTAIETGESLDPASLPAGLTGRLTQLNLDLAPAYAMRKQDAIEVCMLFPPKFLGRQE